MNYAGDTSPICEELHRFTFLKQIQHDGGWKYFDDSGLYDSVESTESNTRSDIYFHTEEITRRIFYSQVKKLTHLVRDREKNLLFVIERDTGSIIQLDMNKTSDGEKDVSEFPILATVDNAWQLCNYSNEGRRVIVCISTIKVSPQTVTYIDGEDIIWTEEFKESISQACVLNTFDVVVITDKSIIKLSGNDGRRIKMIIGGYEGFQSASGICSVAGGGFLVSDERNRQIYSFNNDLDRLKTLNLEIKPSDIYVSDEGNLFIAKGKRKPYTSFIYHLPQNNKN
ncbi:unnamed protein product [Dimorphilus gyrociliatus]|uniref:Uncharacterized protein n=1 Tax=Dimorphilus gyrociliatus TaxID=2664684 RepID=A0A7I8VJF7_9ANNE|nr:unnamed protein product [Dimorphilus gyrociliatus]